MSYEIHRPIFTGFHGGREEEGGGTLSQLLVA